MSIVPRKIINKQLKEPVHIVERKGKTVYEYHVITAEGIEHIFTNVTEFCNLNNLSKCHLINMINKGTFYKGWSGYKLDIKETKEDFNIQVSDSCKEGSVYDKYIYTLTDRDNKEYQFRSLKSFCTDNGICHRTLELLIKKQTDYRGWKLSAKLIKEVQ